MEYVYAAMLLHKAGEDVNEETVTNVLEAAGVEPDESQVKALIASLEDVDIDEALEDATAPRTAAPRQESSGETSEPDTEEDEDGDDEEPDEDEGVSEEEAAEGLGNLFE